MFQIKSKPLYHLIRHNKSKPLRNGRKNYQFLVSKIINVMPTDPVCTSDIEAHKMLRTVAQKIRLHDPKTNFQLRIGFEGCEIKNFDIRQLVKGMTATLKYQQRLALSFSGCSSLEDKAMRRVSHRYIPRLTGIKDYKFDFSGRSISDEELRTLSQKIGRNSKTLRSAAFSFYSCPQITNSGLKYLFRNLALQKNGLKKLELNLCRCENINAEVVAYVARKLKNELKSIQELDIGITICDVMNDKNLVLLGNSIAQMKSLQKLKLNFSYCDSISPTGLNQLCEMLEGNAKQYKEFILNFAGCKGISSKDKASVRPLFASIPKLLFL